MLVLSGEHNKSYI